MDTYGYFLDDLGGYEITSLPKVGYYEYIYKNEELLLKVDQLGIITAQIRPPVGEAIVKREKRENTSPIKIWFALDGKVYHNFDGFQADSLKITFRPHMATYRLTFGTVEVVTELLLTAHDQRFLMKTRFVNLGKTRRELKVLTCCYPYVNELLMAPWDKPEWYTKTQYLPEQDAFLTTRYSVAGKKEERRFLTVVSDQTYDACELSSERLLADCKNFTDIPDAIGGETENTLYAFEQCIAGLKTVSLGGGETFALTQCFAMAQTEAEISQTLKDSREYFAPKKMEAEQHVLTDKFQKLFARKQVKTQQPVFDRFINGFLPLELDWVCALDRGWPTGMRGVRDASNDFQGLIAYDPAQCRSVIETIFSTQRSDGWYPRQAPFGGSGKFDLRDFVDAACFFTEFVYDYLACTGDYSVLEKACGYYDSDILESGLTHLIRGVEHLMAPDHLGEHGLVKIQGGDWLDCLGGAGKNGIGESVMVSCQLVMSIRYLCEILEAVGQAVPAGYQELAEQLERSINEAAWNEQGFYNGVYTDQRTWIFSDRDPDGVKRVYVPTNAYAILSGVAQGKEQTILEHIRHLRTPDGYRLFDHPFGEKHIPGIGKMGTGDFQPYFAENASVYNHGSQGFLLRALAKMGEHAMLEDVLGFMLPMYEEKHPVHKICAAPYAITNCYHLVPSFYGRTGFSFLTGSVAMLERAVYQWLFGIGFDLRNMVLTPCVPASYADAEVTVPYGSSTVKIRFHGFGSKLERVVVGDTAMGISADGRTVKIEKALLQDETHIQVFLGGAP